MSGSFLGAEDKVPCSIAQNNAPGEPTLIWSRALYDHANVADVYISPTSILIISQH